MHRIRSEARRRLLGVAGLSLLSVAAPGALVGCASRPPAEPPPPPKPIAMLAVLPTLVRPPEEDSEDGRGAPAPSEPRRGVVIVPVPGGPNGFSPGDAAAVAGAGLIGVTIIKGIGESRRLARAELRAAVAEINFDARERLDERVRAALAAHGVTTTHVVDRTAAAAISSGQPGAMPAGAEAMLVTEVKKQGYFSSFRAAGFSPVLEVDVAIRPPGADSEPLDEFTYYADWRNGGRDIRWVTTPPALTFASVEALRAGAADVRKGMNEVVDQFAEWIARDVARHTKGQRRID